MLGESQSSCHDFELHGMFVFWMCLGKGFIQLALTTQDVDGGGRAEPEAALTFQSPILAGSARF